MGTYSQTTLKKTVTGNRPLRIFQLTNVQAAASVLKTGFQTVKGYYFETTDPATSAIVVASISGGDITLAADAESQGYAYVWGLLK